MSGKPEKRRKKVDIHRKWINRLGLAYEDGARTMGRKIYRKVEDGPKKKEV